MEVVYLNAGQSVRVPVLALAVLHGPVTQPLGLVLICSLGLLILMFTDQSRNHLHCFLLGEHSDTPDEQPVLPRAEMG